jgi:predicted benzoate:H+ symporter BenE
MDGQTVDFLVYVGVLGVSGALLAVLAVVGLGNRVVNALIAAVALGYTGYLLYEFFTMEAFTYQRFFYAYVLPFIAVYQLYKGFKDRKAAQAQTAPAAQEA